MDSLLLLAGSFIVGIVLGFIYFGGLWYTIRIMQRSTRPGQLFLVSFVARLAVVLGVIYLLGAGSWQRMVAALVGMILVRFYLTHTLGPVHQQLSTGSPRPNAKSGHTAGSGADTQPGTTGD
jgi:F1F0 ATPase subunit 2